MCRLLFCARLFVRYKKNWLGGNLDMRVYGEGVCVQIDQRGMGNGDAQRFRYFDRLEMDGIPTAG